MIQDIKMRVLFFLLISTLMSLKAQSQTTTAFDSIYYKTAIETTGKDPERALTIADSLYKTSKTNVLKIRSLMLSATIQKHQNELNTSNRYALQAYDYAVKEKNYDWQARILGFLSSQYRDMGLPEEGREYINKALKVNEKVSSPEAQKMYLALIEQELAFYASINKEYKGVIEHIEKSLALLDQMKASPNHGYHKVTAEDLRGRAYLALGDFEKAKTSFLKALYDMETLNYNEGALLGYIYMGLGQAYEGTRQDSLAFHYYHLAEEFEISSKHLNLGMALYERMSDLYKEKGDLESYAKYAEKHKERMRQDKKLKQGAVADAFNVKEIARQKSEHLAQIFFFMGLGFVILAIGFVLWYRSKKRKEYRQFEKLIEEVKKNKEKEYKEPVALIDERKRFLSVEAELKIIAKLKEFEIGVSFLEPTTSLSSLATFCETNTKYLSYVLNQVLEKDFNTYINDLRIDYGIKKLQEDEIFREYKISYLASYLGFSSHSKFTVVFKEKTGLTPSLFLSYLEKEERKSRKLEVF